MLALCEFNTGRAIALSERYLHEIDETEFSPLKIGESYLVYGLKFIFDRIDYLVCASGQNPMWAPSSLFKLVDTRIPDNWEICMTKSNSDFALLYDTFKIDCVIGYPSLTNNYSHYIGLLERSIDELQRFFEEKHRADAWWDLTVQECTFVLNASGTELKELFDVINRERVSLSEHNSVTSSIKPQSVKVTNNNGALLWERSTPTLAEWGEVWMPSDIEDRLKKGQYQYVNGETSDTITVVFTPYGGLDFNITFNKINGLVIGKPSEAR
ncbi:hypothetical protein DU000_12440 [Parvibium lacunae]|uniref:Uncharacterized protein n=2 Tax=Parvibium lacunae TaxID=1888893 RepID=A0A368KZB1_9BURK|nr:hypothetical protein DU000_12440 [Parvibium lacunae]